MKLLDGTERSPQNKFLENLSFCIHTLFGIKTEHNKLLKEQEPGTPEYSKSGWRHVIYKLKLFLHRFFFMWRSIFNVSQFLLFPPLLAHQTPHPYSVESYLPIRPLIIQNTEHLSGSWFYTLFMLGEEESAKHRNHLNSNFMVDRKSKCTDANFHFALFLLLITNINNNENASLSTPWCEYLQNVEIHCKSVLTLFRLRFCKAAIFMAWPQRRARKHKRSQRFSQPGRFRLPLTCNPDSCDLAPITHL